MNDVATALGRLEELAIEVPSWAYGNSGTRFKVFGTPGTPRTVQEKLADAAKVHELTGLAPTVALHIPWDKVDDYAALKEYAAGLGVGLGAEHHPGRLQRADGSAVHRAAVRARRHRVHADRPVVPVPVPQGLAALQRQSASPLTPKP